MKIEKLLAQKQEEIVVESDAGTSSASCVANVTAPLGKTQRRGKGSMLQGIKTSAKFPNSQSVKEGAFDKRDAYQRDYDSSITGFDKPQRQDDEGQSNFDDKMRQQTGMIFYNVTDPDKAQQIGLKQTRTGKWFLRTGNRNAQQVADREFGKGKIWYPKNESMEEGQQWPDSSNSLAKRSAVATNLKGAPSKAGRGSGMTVATRVEPTITPTTVQRLGGDRPVPSFLQKEVDEAEANYGGDYQSMVKRVGDMAKQGPRKTVWDPVKKVYKTVPVQPQKEQGVEEARASTASFRQGNAQRAEVNAMSPEERKAHEDNRAEQQRKRDDARMERERQRNASKKGVAEDAHSSEHFMDIVDATNGDVRGIMHELRSSGLHSEIIKFCQWAREQGIADIFEAMKVAQRVGLEVDDENEMAYEGYLRASELLGQQDVAEEKQRLDPKCWTGYKKQGTKMKGDTRVNNCVKVDEAEVSEDKLASDLYKDLQIFKKGADKDIGSKAKDKEISGKAKDKEIIAKVTKKQ